MSNKYLDKIAAMTGSGSVVSSSGSKATKFSAPKMNTTPAAKNKGVKSLRMGPHTTPEDILPNPQKMDIRVK